MMIDENMYATIDTTTKPKQLHLSLIEWTNEQNTKKTRDDSATITNFLRIFFYFSAFL